MVSCPPVHTPAPSANPLYRTEAVKTPLCRSSDSEPWALCYRPEDGLRVEFRSTTILKTNADCILRTILFYEALWLITHCTPFL